MLIAVIVFTIIMLIAVKTDVTSYKIPNVLTLSLLVAWPVAALLYGWSFNDMATTALFAAIILAVGMVLNAFKYVGGGDVKLITGVALWVGAGQLTTFLLMMALAGAVLSLALLVFRRIPLPPVLAAQGWIGTLHQEGAAVPYGVAIAAGALVVMWHPAFGPLAG